MKMDDNGSDVTDLIGYKAMSEAALKGVMCEALKVAQNSDGLPGAHHFYITFRTTASGVSMADHLKDRFPEEMTIVIQHQYWDLKVEQDHFEVVLKFGGTPQHLRIPYAAVTRFFDPAVNFGLAFETDANAAQAMAEAARAVDTPEAKTDDSSTAESESTVVSLDAFRRK